MCVVEPKLSCLLASLPSSFAGSFQRVSASPLFFTADTCATGARGGFGDPSPRGRSQAGSCSQFKQLLLNLS